MNDLTALLLSLLASLGGQEGEQEGEEAHRHPYEPDLPVSMVPS